MKRMFNIVIVLCIVFALATSVSAASTGNITYSDYDTLCMQLDGQDAYCVQRTVQMPETGMSYERVAFNCPDSLKNVVVAISQLDDGSVEFQTASAFAVWQCYETIPMVSFAKVWYNEDIASIVDTILTTANNIDMTYWSVNIEFYGYEGYQTVMTFGVNDTTPVHIPLEDDEIVPEPTIPEPTVPEVPEPTVPEVPEPTVPETPEPTVPEVPEPTVPEVPEPTVPETPEPTVPETPEPTVPVIPEPEVPETTPEPEPPIPPKEVLGEDPVVPTNPKTGDDSNIGLYVAIMVISLVGIICLLISNKKKH